VTTSFLPPGHFLAMRKGAPFAGYEDFSDCTSENSDKRDPDAYCGEIKHQVEGMARTAASGLPQIQQVVDPNNQPVPQDDDLPEGVAFPLGDNAPSSTFGQQWSTGPGGPQPRTGAFQVEAVAWGRRHYEDLASAISGMPEHVRGPVARSFARDLPQATSGMGGVDRDLFERAATDPSGYSWRSRGRQTSYSRGHYQAVADMLRNVRHRGEVSEEDFQHHVYPAIADTMHAGAGFTPNGNRNFDSDRFHKWVHGDEPGQARPQRPRQPRPTRSYEPSAPRREAPSFARGLDPGTESGLSDEGTHYDPYGEGFTNPSRGGRPPEEQTEYDPVFGWVTKGALVRCIALAMDRGHAEALGEADAANGRGARHQDDFGSNKIQHGKYLRAWNNLAGLTHGLTGRPALSKAEYARATGRPDLHPHYLAAYAQGYAQGRTQPRADDGGQVTAAITRQADTWSQPHQSTDDINPPYNSAETSPDPWSQNASPEASDFAAGQAAGRSDRSAGERPLFADNSSGVSPYVKGYAEGYGAAQSPQGQQDVPLSMGGDSGQAVNAQQAAQSFQVARASRHVAGLRRVSAVFAPDSLMADPEFRKGYLFASKWQPGQRLVSTGSARFEAGLYAGVTDRPEMHGEWITAHWLRSGDHPALGRRISLHHSFTRKHGSRNVYLTREAGVSTDLITDGPGSSADPMGSTPLNGPGTPPPMGGLSMPAAPGGAPPYQGAPPLPGGPVVPDDVMGKPQEPAQPDGPFTNTFSGNHPENAVLAPVAPNKADSSGYSNTDAYPPGQGRTALLEAFRGRVAANLARVTAEWYAGDGDDDEDDWEDPRTGDASGSVPEYVDPPRSAPELYEHMMMHHGVTHSPDSTKQPGSAFLQGLHNEMHYGQYRDHPDVVARSVPHHHEPGGY